MIRRTSVIIILAAVFLLFTSTLYAQPRFVVHGYGTSKTGTGNKLDRFDAAREASLLMAELHLNFIQHGVVFKIDPKSLSAKKNEIRYTWNTKSKPVMQYDEAQYEKISDDLVKCTIETDGTEVPRREKVEKLNLTIANSDALNADDWFRYIGVIKKIDEAILRAVVLDAKNKNFVKKNILDLDYLYINYIPGQTTTRVIVEYSVRGITFPAP